MRETKMFNALNRPSVLEKEMIVSFLEKNLQEYGDQASDIRRAIDYGVKEITSFGGFVVVIQEKSKILAAAVVNKTGMSGYIPENILVYIASHTDYRGQGLGSSLMQEVIDCAQGDIALHVEADNPAKKLYEKYGFSNPYLEMRLKRQR